MNPTEIPSSPDATVGGLLYFGRMVDKIRKHARGTLRADYHANLGQGMDSRLCRFLHVDYAALRDIVLAGADDAQALDWCLRQRVLPLGEDEVLIWNDFLRKRGWNDSGTAILEKHKAAAGLGARADIRTFHEFWAVDEGRAP